MPTYIKEPGVLFPRSVRELLNQYNENPGSVIFAGGTEIMMKGRDKPGLSAGTVISLKYVTELMKVVRRERFLEIGAAVPLSKIISIGNRVVPAVLYNSILCSGNPGIRNLATIGGLLCSSSSSSEVLAILHAMDAQLEVRSTLHTGWVLISSFKKREGKSILSGNEILTRIRIPYGDWNRSYSRVVRINPCSGYPQVSTAALQTNPGVCPAVIFSALARVSKNSLEDIRFAFGGLGKQIIRERSIEITLIGKKIPLAGKDPEIFRKQIEELLRSHSEQETPADIETPAKRGFLKSADAYRIAVMKRILLWFLNNLEYPDYLQQMRGLQNRQRKLYF